MLIIIFRQVLFLLLLASTAVGQVYWQRVHGHTPSYEWIFHPRNLFAVPPANTPLAKSPVEELGSTDQYSGTNRIDHIFADPSKERTNNLYASCLREVPIDTISLHCPGGLLDTEQCREILRRSVAIPRNIWTNYAPGPLRCVISQTGTNDHAFVIYLRSDSFAIVFFPDDTYRCVIGPGFSFLEPTK